MGAMMERSKMTVTMMFEGHPQDLDDLYHLLCEKVYEIGDFRTRRIGILKSIEKIDD